MALATTERTLSEIALPLTQDKDLDSLLFEIAEARFVLIGEASHGTSDFYSWRSALTRRLIEGKNFDFVAVEGDWPACYEINSFIKKYDNSKNTAKEALNVFKRWPTWMWANQEVLRFVEWLKNHNQSLPVEKRVGFYGLDVYSLWESLGEVTSYLKQRYPELLPDAQQAYKCFEPYADDEYAYAQATAFLPKNCEAEVVDLLVKLRQKNNKKNKSQDDFEAAFNAEQNMHVVVNAERYYRAMVQGSSNSWNVRDQHMVETLYNIAKRYGGSSKGIVWAHNTHVGDARFTDMATAGMVNIGQLVRQQESREEVFLIGFGTYSGSVIAGRYWDAPAEVMDVPPAKENSWEEEMHDSVAANALFLSRDLQSITGSNHPFGHRAIGVVYNPERERGNYVPTILSGRYDSFLFIDRSHALHPLHGEHPNLKELPETFPYAF